MQVTISSASFVPVHFLFAVAVNENDVIVIPKYPMKSTEWESALIDDAFLSVEVEDLLVDIAWMSILENKFYGCKLSINKELAEQGRIMIGCTSYGYVGIWSHSIHKCRLISYLKGLSIDMEVEDFIKREGYVMDVPAYYAQDEKDLMNQYIYRYRVLFDKADYNLDFNFEHIEEVLYDGTYDKLHDGGLMKYHEAGKPRKLALKWNEGKTEYSAFFWFDYEEITQVFDRFYGVHRDTKTDFIIRMDCQNKKCELSMYRFGLKEPKAIPETAYQVLVFKNGFEDYRSENYSQARGAWIW